MTDQNKKTIRMLREQAPTNPSVLDGLYTDDYVYHGIPLLGDLKRPAAFPMLPAWMTAIKISRSRNLSRRLMRSSHGMAAIHSLKL